MYQEIEDLPDHVIGLKITGKITAQDYREHLIPLVEEKLKIHKRIDCLCLIEHRFPGVEPAAMWEDLRLGISNMNHWGRIALVTDLDWIENSINFFKIFWPGHLRQFDLDDYDRAKDWVCERHRALIDVNLDVDNGLLILNPSQVHSLTVYDFEYITKIADDYLAQHPTINGILISSRHFPGWQGLTAMMSHLKFVHDHHRKIERIAVVTNSPMGKFADHISDHFIKAKIKSFEYDQYDNAILWLKKEMPS